MAVLPGDLLAGKYRVVRILGAGAMGVVLEAEHVGLGKRVALKLLRSQEEQSRMATTRFLREARAAVQLESEHVARVSDVGTIEDGTPYLVMELLDGMDLATLCRRVGALPIGQAVGYLIEACDAMAEAHSLGIVHRDLKPANLFLARRRDGSTVIKVIDFGISKAPVGVASESAAQTSTGTIIGSPLYMAPEQLAAAKHVDARADIWSLGVVLYQLLSGTTPFDGKTIAVVCAQIIGSTAPPLRGVLPTAPVELEAIVARCLERDPGRRFQDVAELAVCLRPFAPASYEGLVERIVTVLRPSHSASQLREQLVARGSAPSLRAAASSDASAPSPKVEAVSQTRSSWGATQAEATATARGRARMVLVAAVAVTAVGVGLTAAAVFVRARPPNEGASAADPAPPLVATAAQDPAVRATPESEEQAAGAPSSADSSSPAVESTSGAPSMPSAAAPSAAAPSAAASSMTGARPRTASPPARPASTASARASGTSGLPDFGGRVY